MAMHEQDRQACRALTDAFGDLGNTEGKTYH